ncbi:MAG: DUF2946 domain-containing protein [Burkholderiaceae bacterium]
MRYPACTIRTTKNYTVKMQKWRNRYTAWIVCLAILAAAFMPSVSAALTLAHQNAAFAAPICSAEHSAHDIAEQTQAPAHQGGHTDHCPLCVKHSNAFAMPRPPGFAALDLAADSLPQSSGHESFYSAVTWIHLPSRAPPARI